MSNKLTTWFLALTLGLMFGVYWQLYLLKATVRELGKVVARTEAPIEVWKMTHSHVSGGQTRTLVVNRKQGETTADWIARYHVEVDAFFVTWPPD